MFKPQSESSADFGADRQKTLPASMLHCRIFGRAGTSAERVGMNIWLDEFTFVQHNPNQQTT